MANQRVWAAIKGGPHTNNPDNGEEYFDKGSLAIMNGDRPLIVNATGALLRNTPSTSDGSDYYNLIYDDDFSDKGQRDVYNIFYTRQPVPRGQGNRLRTDGVRTRSRCVRKPANSRFVSPRNATGHKVYRLIINRPTTTGAKSAQWLTVIDAAANPQAGTNAKPLTVAASWGFYCKERHPTRRCWQVRCPARSAIWCRRRKPRI